MYLGAGIFFRACHSKKGVKLSTVPRLSNESIVLFRHTVLQSAENTGMCMSCGSRGHLQNPDFFVRIADHAIACSQCKQRLYFVATDECEPDDPTDDPQALGRWAQLSSRRLEGLEFVGRCVFSPKAAGYVLQSLYEKF
jgi:hypothetical protein